MLQVKGWGQGELGRGSRTMSKTWDSLSPRRMLHSTHRVVLAPPAALGHYNQFVCYGA